MSIDQAHLPPLGAPDLSAHMSRMHDLYDTRLSPVLDDPECQMGVAPALLTRTDLLMTADPRRVLARPFVPGHAALPEHAPGASGVLAHILALPEDVIDGLLTDVLARYADRHRDLPAVMDAHFKQVAPLLPPGVTMTAARRSLLGAWFTNEFSIEGAALCNPSAVPHPDQSNLGPGQRRFVLSLRAVGEGHLSCVEFRTGVVGPGQQLRIDNPAPYLETGQITPAPIDRMQFAAALGDTGADPSSAVALLSRLPAQFDADALELALADLTSERPTDRDDGRTEELARRIARCSYAVEFAPSTSLTERVLWPHSPSESRGIEDARFVRFIEEDGGAIYRATYTAYDGVHIVPQLIETTDFRHFAISPLGGPGAKNKGLALFPRKVGGRYLALSRFDGATNSLTTSDDNQWWGDPQPLHAPRQPWELLQTGNCGSPVETDAGWLVLTHGVGPMREYTIGALLLDLDDPSRVIGGLREPLLRPTPGEHEGYVPNVVYSCGAMLHGDQLLLPYGVSDASVRFAFVDVPLLLDRLTAEPYSLLDTHRVGPAPRAFLR